LAILIETAIIMLPPSQVLINNDPINLGDRV